MIRVTRMRSSQRCPECGLDYDPSEPHSCAPHDVSTPAKARGFIRTKVERIDTDRDVDGLIAAIATLLQENARKPT
jgi:hypothetical protein